MKATMEEVLRKPAEIVKMLMKCNNRQKNSCVVCDCCYDCLQFVKVAAIFVPTARSVRKI